MLSLVIASMILIFLIPQQLQATHEQLVDKTVAQMNQLVLAARNYYQNQRLLVGNNASAWPTTLSQLTSNGYLPNAALCSAWPKGTAAEQNKANNNGNDCGNQQEYALFPANSSTGLYDTTVPGIAVTGSNSGGSFWGVSLALPTAKAAAEVRERMPFATTCPPSELSKTSTACSTTGNIVTAVVPRPAQWPGFGSTATYAKDGLIQTMGSQVICNSAATCQASPVATIPIPQTCGNDENGFSLTPQLFAYPLSYQYGSGVSTSYPGIHTFISRNSATWTVRLGGNGVNNPNSAAFTYLSIGYFTVCQPHTSVTGDWIVF